ncbi:MAG: hypothetical protein HQ477_11895 [Chloroflexi bacterium]|nr:hypothetical protein [Chloroflexota bacterium]
MSVVLPIGPHICEPGFALRPDNQKARGSATQPIEDACRQALSGAFGLASEIGLQYLKQQTAFTTMFIPVVVTTAPLFVASYQASEIDLSSGMISEEKVFFGADGPEAVDWLVVDYPTGDSIVPDAIPDSVSAIDAGILGELK